METVKQFVLETIRLFVDHPTEVEVWAKEEEGTDIVNVHVKTNKNDVGVCIGSKGSTAEALRKIIGIIGFKQTGKKIYVKIEAPKIPKNHFYQEG